MTPAAESQLIEHVARARLILAVLLCAIYSATLVHGQYRFDTRSTEHGLPQNSVHSIIQTRDGYLWFTTFDGLVRYDGVRFTVFDRGSTRGLGSNRFNCLYEADDGTLWAGTQDGGLTRYKDGAFKTYTTTDGLPHNGISGISDDGKHGLLVWTRSGVALWQDGHFILHPHPLLHQFVERSRWGYRDSSGAVWVVGQGQLRQVQNDHVATYAQADGLTDPSVSCIYEDHQKRLWLGTQNGNLFRREGDRFVVPTYRGKLPAMRIDAINEDRNGDLWVATYGGGLARLSGDQVTVFTTADGLPSNHVVSIFEDREGSLWVGTSNHGLALVRREAVRFLAQEDGLSGVNVYPILEDAAGAVWIGTWDGGLNRFFEGRFAPLPLRQSLPQYLITALHQDRAGRMWIGHYRGIGRLEEGKFVDLAPELGLENKAVFTIHEDRGGAFWFGTREGLYRYVDGVVTRYTSADGLAGNDVKDILEDPAGNLWIATYGGLSRWHEGRLSSLTTKDGLASDYVRTLYQDSAGTLWIGTYDGGLSRLRDGNFTNYTTADGLFSNGVFRILDDQRGNFWMSSNRGIFRVSRDQLEAFAAGSVHQLTSVSYGKEDGLAHTECNGGQQPAGFRTRDGKLWFPTQGGVAVVDPNKVTTNSHPPPVVIEDGLLDREPIVLGPTLRIEPGRENLEIRYTGLSLLNPEHVVFRYRMEGLDANWVEAGTRRTANYSHLPPGKYIFRVTAANSDGVWNDTGAALNIVVVPPFWRTWWFTGLIVLSLGGLAHSFYRLQMSRVRKAHATQRAFSQQLIELQEDERKRIAAGLHDSLGQNLLIIKNRALLGLQSPSGNDVARDQLEEISGISSQTLDEVREIAYGLHPYQMDRLGLTKALQSMLRKVAAVSEIEFSVDIDNIDGLFPADSQINIYRIVQECVNNILKHSGASTARVAIKRDKWTVQISVADDGKGFSSDLNVRSSTGLGFGLLGMSERARMLGGNQTIQSTPGKGTTVTVRIELQENSNGQ